MRRITRLCSAMSFAHTVVGVLLAAGLACPALAAHKYRILHNFTGGLDGGAPGYTLATDAAGNFIGTANFGGNGYGIIFSLARKHGNWDLRVLYDFRSKDGQPGWGVTVSPTGSFYVNASYAEVLGGACGSALELQHSPAHKPARWSKTLLRTYVKSEEGCPTGNLIGDAVGNLYGVTQNGGANGWGSIFELSPSDSGWTETILYSFQGASDGGAPYSGMVFDAQGNLYGTATASSGVNSGTVFEFSPSQSGWIYNVLYTFTGGQDGGQPVAGLVFDGAGNLYGATASWGANGGGTIFELSPAGGLWTFKVLHSLSGSDGPVASLTLDSAGALYGTNFMDGAYGYGSVFKLSPGADKWRYSDLHDFTGGTDGGYPGGGVVLGANGDLYGTAVLGGSDGFGVVYEVTQ